MVVVVVGGWVVGGGITQQQQPSPHPHPLFKSIKPHSFKIMSQSPHYQYNWPDITHSGPLLDSQFFGKRPRQLGLGNVASFFGDADESGALDVFS